jgi:ParB family chromosome partitioning protein
MVGKRKTLGRGLDALLGPGPRGKDESAEGGELRHLAIDLLQRGKYQPRHDMRPESLQDLADSIRAQGVVQPIVVRPLAPQAGQPRRYEIIAGERRWRAAQIAGLQEMPAVIRDVPDEAAVAIALIENIQRENLNPLEEAIALTRLINEFEMTHQQAADAVGRSRAAVSNLLRLLELADDVKTMMEERKLEMGHARALLGLPSARQQVEVARTVASRGLSVRETEAMVRRALKPAPAKPAKAAVDPDIRALEGELGDKLGAKVHIQTAQGGKGKLVIAYNSLDELEGILGHIR